MNMPGQKAKLGILKWLEWCVLIGFGLVAITAVEKTFYAQESELGEKSVFSQLLARTDALSRETDSIRRDNLCIPLSAYGRSIAAQIPSNSKVFITDMLGSENGGRLGYYYFLENYLYPREVAVSLDGPAVFGVKGLTGHKPASLEEIKNAGYDLVVNKELKCQVLRPLTTVVNETKSTAIPETDTFITFLLPLAVALAGSRIIRWLFKDLRGLLTMGELLATGLAVGIFFTTQFILFLRIIGIRLERGLAILIMIWAVVEILQIIRDWKSKTLKLQASHCWFFLLIPVGLIFWCLFRLAGLEGLQEFDAVANWELKSKMFYYATGNGIGNWKNNPQFGFAHLDYPLTVTLLYTFTYEALGHVNEFVIKFWNQWMLLLLAWAALATGSFPNKRPWLITSAVTVLILMPITLLFARKEGGTIPLLFFVGLASIQLAVGFVEKNAGRLRLGLFILTGAAMVKFEGGMLLAIWGGVLLLNKETRSLFWPINNIGFALPVGLIAWIPYLLFRSDISIIHPDNLAVSFLLHHWNVAWSYLPMTWVSLVSGRFLNNEFVFWNSPDNQHAVWQGNWSGLGSLVDSSTFGFGWVCLATLILFFYKGHQLRRLALCFFALFMIYTFPICLECLTGAFSNQTCAEDFSISLDQINFSTVLKSTGETISGGRYLTPLMMSWFLAASVLLSRQGLGKSENLLPSTKVKPKKLSGQGKT